MGRRAGNNNNSPKKAMSGGGSSESSSSKKEVQRISVEAFKAKLKEKFIDSLNLIVDYSNEGKDNPNGPAHHGANADRANDQQNNAMPHKRNNQ